MKNVLLFIVFTQITCAYGMNQSGEGSDLQQIRSTIRQQHLGEIFSNLLDDAHAALHFLEENPDFDANSGDLNNIPVLLRAIEMPTIDPKIIEALLVKGADAAVINKQGKTPLVIAFERYIADSEVQNYPKIIGLFTSNLANYSLSARIKMDYMYIQKLTDRYRAEALTQIKLLKDNA